MASEDGWHSDEDAAFASEEAAPHAWDRPEGHHTEEQPQEQEQEQKQEQNQSEASTLASETGAASTMNGMNGMNSVDAMSTIDELPLSKDILRAALKMGFERPTPVQAQAIPAILAGKDVLAQAPSGSGKTAAFALPALENVDPDGGLQVVILTPVKPLADQIVSALDGLGAADRKLRVACCVGGGAGTSTRELVQRPPHICVGTPSRILDLAGMARDGNGEMTRQRIDLSAVKLLVLDEADEIVIRPEFQEQIKVFVTESLPASVQVALFSATLSEESMKVGWNLCRPQNTEVIRAAGPDGSSSRPAISHFHVGIGPKDQHHWETRAEYIEDLCQVFGAAQNIVFVRTKEQGKLLSDLLRADMRGSPFTTDLDQFRAGRHRVLLATDALGRGIDVQTVALVINFEMPTTRDHRNWIVPADDKYTQRAGRAGRFGRAGVCITLVDDDDLESGKWGMVTMLENKLGFEIPHLDNRDLERLPGVGDPKDNHAAPTPAPVPTPTPTPAPTAAVAPASSRPNAWGVGPSIPVPSAAAAPVTSSGSSGSRPRDEAEADASEELRRKVLDLEKRLAEAEAVGREQRERAATAQAREEAAAARALQAEGQLQEKEMERAVLSQALLDKQEECERLAAQLQYMEPASFAPSCGKSLPSLPSSTVSTATTAASGEEVSTISNQSSVETPVCVTDWSQSGTSGARSKRSRRRKLGKGSLDPAKLALGQRFMGMVVKLHAKGVFVTFGDEHVRCDKDGFVRHGWQGLKMDQSVDVEVAQVYFATGKHRVELNLV